MTLERDFERVARFIARKSGNNRRTENNKTQCIRVCGICVTQERNFERVSRFVAQKKEKMAESSKKKARCVEQSREMDESKPEQNSQIFASVDPIPSRGVSHI